MRPTDTGLLLSATDLANFLACRHRTALDLGVAGGVHRAPPKYDDPLLDLLKQRGLEHERAYVDGLRDKDLTVESIAEGEVPERVARTVAAMRGGVDVIVQGALADGDWLGYADIIRRVETPSDLGSWSYEVEDTKLARHTRGATILQLSLYSDLVGRIQGTTPAQFHVVTPFDRHSYRVNAYAAYYRLVRDQLLEAIATGREALYEANYPEPVEFCGMCRWNSRCKQRRLDDDHLSQVAGITRLQRRELVTANVGTMAALAGLPHPIPFEPKRGSVETYERVRDQARLQVESRGREVPTWALRTVTADPEEGPQGLERLPAPSPGDVFLDLEGDAFSTDGGREYLFGLVTIQGDGSPRYHAWWGLTSHDERVAFEAVVDLVTARIAERPDAHIYHYAHYEPTALKRLMGTYATRAEEVDALLRGERFVDLYAVVRQSMLVGVDRYSIKCLEPLYGYTRDVRLEDANRYLRRMEHALALGVAHELPGEVLAAVEGYNRDDCVSTWRLRDWLEGVRADAIAQGREVPRPVPREAEASEDVSEEIRNVEEVRKELLAGIPEDTDARSPEQQARWTLAYLLDWHRREEKVVWWEYYRLLDMADEGLLDEAEAVAGLTFVSRISVSGKGRRQSVVDRYRFPTQEMELRPGDPLRSREKGGWGKVVGIDRHAHTIDVHKGPSKADEHPSSAFRFQHFDAAAMKEALLAYGRSVASMTGRSLAASTSLRPQADLLLRSTPRLAGRSFDPNSSLENIIATAVGLDRSVVALQGPPGAGKTYSAAHMICALAASGKRVGVTAQSHRVILNVLRAAHDEAQKLGTSIALGHKDGGDESQRVPWVEAFTDNGKALDALADGSIQVLGGTSWLWANAKAAGVADVLFVDEAGQLSLANVVAAARGGRNLVLLGDPRQLEQPRRGTHPPGVGRSALEYLLDEHVTMPDDRGLFLPTTRRLPPPICSLTSELFYEDRLKPYQHTARQVITGSGLVDGHGLWLCGVEHEGNTNASMEEVDVVERLVDRLLRPGVGWVDQEGERRPLEAKNILVVAPYNAQVFRLDERLRVRGARVGTVDLFQGQEAPVVIYSMATSRPEDAPRGMEFLYSLNRFNVATSRAQCAAIVVASEALFAPECHTPRQMELANALCRYREVAGRLVP